MKNLLAFTAFLAAGFLLGSRRARKAGPISVINMAVEVDTSAAMPALYRLQKQAEKTTAALSAVVVAGDNLQLLNQGLWIDEQGSKPDEGKEVYVSIVRRAVRNSGAWQLTSPEPISLDTDTVHWMEIPAK